MSGGIFWLASYPKSGNTWMRAFLRNLQDQCEAPADINALHTGAIASARGWLDDLLGVDTADLRVEEVDRLRPALHAWASLEASVTGFHKIHDACVRTPCGEPLIDGASARGVLYIVRNPLDVALSTANHWQCSVDQAIERLSSMDQVLSSSSRGPGSQVRQQLLSWSSHVESWIDGFAGPLLWVRYEDMLNDSCATFTEVASFLGLSTEVVDIERAIRHSQFKELVKQETALGFKERPSRVSSFFRQGQAGGWRAVLSESQVAAVIERHAAVMFRLGYLDDTGQPL